MNRPRSKPSRLVHTSEIAVVKPGQRVRTSSMDECASVVVQNRGTSFFWHAFPTHTTMFRNGRGRIVDRWNSDKEHRSYLRNNLANSLENGRTHDELSTQSMHPRAIARGMAKAARGVDPEGRVVVHLFAGSKSLDERESKRALTIQKSIFKDLKKQGHVDDVVVHWDDGGKKIGSERVIVDENGHLHMEGVREY